MRLEGVRHHPAINVIESLRKREIRLEIRSDEIRLGFESLRKREIRLEIRLDEMRLGFESLRKREIRLEIRSDEMRLVRFRIPQEARD